MCGIAGLYLKKELKDIPNVTHDDLEVFVDGLLMGIEPRGRHATGIASMFGNKIKLDKKDIPASEFIFKRRCLPKSVKGIILHTRWATQGSPTQNENNHPVTYGGVMAVHNGHIQNDRELFASQKLQRKAEVDSSIIPALFSKYGIDKAHLALQKLEGNMATAIIDPKRNPNTVLLAKGEGSPLVVFENDNVIAWASTTTAITEAFEAVYGKGARPAWDSLTHLKAGEIWIISPEGIEKLNYEVKERYKHVYTAPKRSSNPTGPETRGVSITANARTWDGSYKSCVGCGCTSFWHEGWKANGRCLSKINGTSCQCSAFKEAPAKATYEQGNPKQPVPKEPGSTAYYADTNDDGTRTITAVSSLGTRIVYGACDGCQTAFLWDTLTRMGGYMFCDGCWSVEDKEEGNLPAAAGPIVQGMLGFSVDAGSEDVEGEIVPGDYTPEQIREMVLQRTCDDLNLEPTHLEFILFEADEAYITSKESLLNYRILAEEAWMENEKEVRDECGMGDDSSCGVTAFEEEARPRPVAKTVTQ